MIATQTQDLLRRLRKGTKEASDLTFLEQVNGSGWIAELKTAFRLTFQERHVGGKWEISLARRRRTELVSRPIRNSPFVSFIVVPVYDDCLMLNLEDNAVTGVSRLDRLMVRAVAKPVPGLALTTGRGFKFDKTPDGWEVKRLRRRTVRLSESFLQARGWHFDHMSLFMTTP
jgi:hypothetical protein